MQYVPKIMRTDRTLVHTRFTHQSYFTDTGLSVTEDP